MLRNENMKWKNKTNDGFTRWKIYPKSIFLSFFLPVSPVPSQPEVFVVRYSESIWLPVCLWLRVWRMNDFIKIDCINLSFCFVFSSPFPSLHHFFGIKTFFTSISITLLCPVHNHHPSPSLNRSQPSQTKLSVYCDVQQQ